MISFNSTVLPIGIPLVKQYKNLLKTDLFLEMESFSSTFLENHWKTLKNYRRRWVADPFHQWSRQWEYPFVYSYIQQYVISNNNYIHAGDKIRILDAGSGCTFFPYYLSYKIPNCKVYCCDNDPSLSPLFIDINKKMNMEVEFNVYDLEKLRYKDNIFDIIYCISVLEHTCNYVDIIKQFKCVLNPHGLLIVTFDIAVDNKTTIDWAQGLLSELDNKFRATINSCKYSSETFKSLTLTTEFARTFDKKLLPWKLTWASFAGQLLKLKRPKIPFHNLTIFCGVWKEDRTTTQS